MTRGREPARHDRGPRALGGRTAPLARLEVSDERAVVELCTCYGEPVDTVQSEAPELIEFVRAHRRRLRASCLDQLGRARRAVVRRRPCGQLARPSRQRADRRAPGGRRAAASRGSAAATGAGRRRRPSRPRGVLAHVAGVRHREHRAARRERPRHRPVSGVGDHERAARHRAPVGDPLDQPRVARHAHGVGERLAVGRGEHADGLVRQARAALRAAAGARGPGRSTARSGPAARRPAAARRRRTAAPRPAGRRRGPPGGQARGYSSCGKVPTMHSGALMPPCSRSAGGRPSRRRVSLSSARPCRRPGLDRRAALTRQSAPAEGGPGQPRAERIRRKAGRARRDADGG